MPDYPVRDGNGNIIIAVPHQSIGTPPVRDPGKDYPVRNGDGVIIEAKPYEGYVPPVPPLPPSLILMTDPHNVNGALTESNLTATGADYVTTNTGTKSFSFPTPPVGSRIRATISADDADVVWRNASKTTLTGTIQDKYRTLAGGVTNYQIDYIVSVSDGAFFGVITAQHPRTFTVRNFRVDAPA